MKGYDLHKNVTIRKNTLSGGIAKHALGCSCHECIKDRASTYDSHPVSEKGGICFCNSPTVHGLKLNT